MKILYYNWVDYLDPEKRGGGVSVYQKNLIGELGVKPDLDIYFISSGISYDPVSNAPRWERVKHGPKENRNRRFEIINSGVLSPGHHSFGHGSQVDHPATTEAFFDFMEKHGPFDVVHFNNLEGIPATCVALKKRFPKTKVVFAFHNYYPVCPQVNLWYREEQNCLDFEDGRKCEHCLVYHNDSQIIRQANAVAYKLKKLGATPGTKTFDRLFGRGINRSNQYLEKTRKWRKTSRDVLGFVEKVSQEYSAGPFSHVGEPHLKFRRRREQIAKIINENADRVLVVSDRVGVVAAKFGIEERLIQTSYIGTKQAAKFLETKPKASLLAPDGSVTIGYLGYMRRDKGFFFLMDALAALPPSLANRVNLIIGAQRGDDEAMGKLNHLGRHLKSVRHADGYSHDQLDDMLADVDVGVIPVLWEDNLPQVAIEMHCRHIPLLTSNLGGAQELGNTKEMVFDAGDIDSFRTRIGSILDGLVDLRRYWTNARRPISMAEHEEELLGIYRELIEGPRMLPVVVPHPDRKPEGPEAAVATPENAPEAAAEAEGTDAEAREPAPQN